MIINLLVATIDEGLIRVKDLLLNRRPDLRYIVAHQVTDERYRDIPQELKREDVTIIQQEGRGLARNRNQALNLAGGDIALLADDDARYREEYLDVLQSVFCRAEGPDVACFKIATPSGEAEYKDYAAHPYDLCRKSHHYISSLEIVFRPAVIRANKIVFDERFGLGSELINSGEEAVFIHDCIRAGLKVEYFPYYIVNHPATSSFNILGEFSRERILLKGAYDARRYGWPAIPAAFIDTVKLRRRLKAAGVTGKAYLRERLRGAFYILTTNKFMQNSIS